MTSNNEIAERLDVLIDDDDADGLEELLGRSGVEVELGSLLVTVSGEEKLNCLSKLVELGADVNYVNSEGETPLSWACAWNRLDSAKLLYRFGADVNRPSNGYTPLDIAVCRTPPEFRDWLRSIGAQRLHQFDEWPWPPPT